MSANRHVYSCFVFCTMLQVQKKCMLICQKFSELLTSLLSWHWNLKQGCRSHMSLPLLDYRTLPLSLHLYYKVFYSSAGQSWKHLPGFHCYRSIVLSNKQLEAQWVSCRINRHLLYLQSFYWDKTYRSRYLDMHILILDSTLVLTWATFMIRTAQWILTMGRCGMGKFFSIWFNWSHDMYSAIHSPEKLTRNTNSLIVGQLLLSN